MVRSSPRQFWQDQTGATAALYALALPALVMAAGVAYDYSRLAGLDSELQNAADQAALAAATQLDSESGACSRAAAAASSLVSNRAILANDGLGIDVSVANESTCDAVGAVRFWQDRDGTTAATSDGNAHFVEVVFDANNPTPNGRVAHYAFTPITGLFYGSVGGRALAGVGSSICKVPPMMICSPDPTQPFNAAGKKGWGIQVTGHGNTQSGTGGTVGAWGPGDFGFLEVGAGQNSDLVEALAFDTTTLDCVPIDGTKPETGNPQALYDALNTRFDIYDFASGNGTTLAPCFSGRCPAASNVVKDVVKADTSTNGQSCKLHNTGWHLPPEDRQFWPKPASSITSTDPLQDYNDTTHSPSIDAMGLPRDLCHYASYGQACGNDPNNRYGNGIWARGDYFDKYHGGAPTGAGSWTRYETYLWELGLLKNASGSYVTGGSVPGANTTPLGVAAGSDRQYGGPVCSTGTPAASRRVLTVAIVKNCSSLSGSSTAVKVDEWVDMFLVEPVIDARPNGSIADSIYMEIIGPSHLGGEGNVSGGQDIRKDVPYLIK
ncbi:pilus assembly protein TadG-related protein [Novosphingobium mangrovi (ex Huang et al. 2023)]|uniref:Pilus assembly protein TadG-related protein n=1 Tax=Novosphingobium mangrovi (ex Huang et al. 2023) TaxID=2976432 RepID=A0ABT2I5H6_9SPHN|nr:pilus assembly protein TadG-related protein [Novosphingobium mangrovi (ex Huang et al. 2023)]MCT2400061.1 pilus assembly protein TadG-related protein [Novosphingobium mangrovi (ex Huang et al. 2023)]